MAAILSSAFSLLRLACAISADTVLRSALRFSTLTKMSRRLASISFISFKIAASTPRVANFLATASKSVRIRLISNIASPLTKNTPVTVLEWQSHGSIQLHRCALDSILYFKETVEFQLRFLSARSNRRLSERDS